PQRLRTDRRQFIQLCGQPRYVLARVEGAMEPRLCSTRGSAPEKNCRKGTLPPRPRQAIRRPALPVPLAIHKIARRYIQPSLRRGSELRILELGAERYRHEAP